MSEPNTLQVSLDGVRVGTLRLLTGGRDATEFRFLPSYLELLRRPVLGQAFEDDLAAVHTARVRLPAFFSNLLPEGLLRELLAQRAGVSPTREFFLLAELGKDLPGAVVVEPAGPLTSDEGEISDELPDPPKSVEHPLRFSVAGLQLKFSIVQNAGRWVLPVTGEGGRWLLKVPHPDYRGVPHNEFAMMSWAGLVGIEVPETRLIRLADVGGLPEELKFAEPEALLVRRFDRTETGRVHMEDFLQVLNRHPDDRAKYRATNMDSVGRFLVRLENGGLRDLRQLVRRILFNAAIGNGDAHLKNWSLLYRDRQWPSLAPAYDLVSTVHYLPKEQDLALNVARVKRYDELTHGVFEAFARHVGVDPKAVRDWVDATVEQLHHTWPEARRTLPISEALAATVERQMRRVPVLTRSA